MKSIISLLTPKKMTFFLKEDATIRQALEKFDAHKFTVVPIINKEGKYCGTLSEGDILRFIKNVAKFNMSIAENICIKDIDHYRPYRALRVDALIIEVFGLSMEQNFIPVIDDKDVFIGIIKRRDVIRELSEELPKRLEENK